MKRGSGPGNICSVSVSFVRVGSQIFARWAKKDQISPPPGEQDQSNALPQGQQRQSNPHPMPCPRRLYIDRCITPRQKLQNMRACRGKTGLSSMKLNRWMIHMFPLFPLGYSGLGKIEATLLAGWNCGRLAPKVAPPY